MMPTMGPGVMFGMEVSMLLWIVLATLVSLLVIGACVWLALSLLKKQRISPKQYSDQPQDAYPTYERGYQAEQPSAETYQEAGEFHSYSEPRPQYEQPQAQYPQAVSSER